MTNKLCVWDLDGVLIESRELHYESLNEALRRCDPKYVISKEEHLSLYDGLNTTKKLDMLTSRKGLPKSEHDNIWRNKQIATFDFVKKFSRDERAIRVFKTLRERGWKIAVCSNSIRETVKLSLISIGVIEYVDYFVSNEDVKRTKPYPEMYWKAMTALDALPKNTIIIEDSHIGRQGAIDSGAHLLAVENSHDWDYEKIMKEVDLIENKPKNSKIPWRDSKLTILVPMAGAGSRFATAGYAFPKPLIEVAVGNDERKPMIQVVVENLNMEANYIFLVQKEHYEKYHLKYLLNMIAPGCKIVMVNGITEGAACTTLLAKEFINNENPLVICNSDQYIEGFSSNEVMYSFKTDSIDGGVLTFKSTHPKWSYVSLGEDGFISEVAEKRVISDNATVGFYYFAKGSDYVNAAETMIGEGHKENGEYYVAPSISYAIRNGKKFKIKEIGRMWGIGTPTDLDYFHENYKKKE